MTGKPRGISTPCIHIIIICLITTVNVLIFMPSIGGDFIFDDIPLIKNNPIIQHPRITSELLLSPFWNVSMYWTKGTGNVGSPFFRPVVSFTYWLDFQIYGNNPSGYHITNIIMSILSGLLLYLLAIKLKIKPIAAGFMGLLFSVFPTHFENVAWISGRPDILSFLFLLSAIVLFLYLEEKKKTWLIFPISLSLFLSLLSKENIVILALFFIFILIKDKSIYHRKAMGIAAGSTVIIWMAFRFLILDSQTIGFTLRKAVAMINGLGFYCTSLFFPMNLSFSIPVKSITENPVYLIIGIFMAMAFMYSCWTIVARKKLTYDGFHFLMVTLFLTILPHLVAMIIPNNFSPVAWRYFYLPSSVFIIFLTIFLFRFIKLKWAGNLVMVMLLLFASTELLEKNAKYGLKERDFWLSMTEFHRENFSFQCNIAQFTMEVNEAEGEKMLHSLLEKKDNPFYGKVNHRILAFLGNHYSKKNLNDKALRYFEQIFRDRTPVPFAIQIQYAFALARADKTNQGDPIVLGFLASYPDNHHVLSLCSQYFILSENYQKAAEILKRDLRLFPNEDAREKLRMVNGKLHKTTE